MSSSSTNVSDIDRSRPMTREEKKVILASSAGTIFEWYDFYLYGSLAAVIGQQFFTAFPEATRNVYTLLAFAAGFLVRPFGALVFGSLGDLVGRKYTFLMTISIMGISTFLVGCLPTYDSWGVAAPIILIILRMLQGLALGGEYGGAAVYVAEHAPQHRRGYFTSFIQTTATIGLLLSLIVIMITTKLVNTYGTPVEVIQNGVARTLTPWDAWGWRVPFLLSAILLIISLYIRMQMQESPQFQRIKAEGMTSKTPLRETFGRWQNAKWAVIALFGLTAGQAVVWYSGQFYALFFLRSVAKIDPFTVNVLVAWSLILATAGFIFFGSLSDRIGRKSIILTGCLLAALSYFFVFGQLMKWSNPQLAAAQETLVEVIADPEDCSFQFNPTGIAKFNKSCDVAKNALYANSVNYETVDGPAGQPAVVRIGDVTVPSYDATLLADLKRQIDEAVKSGDQATADSLAAPLAPEQAKADAFTAALNAALSDVGYPINAADNTSKVAMNHFFDIFSLTKIVLILLLTYLVLLVTMVYGPIAAALVELFPTRIRYSGMSLPYHIGNGWFGGFLPATAFAISAVTGNIYSGLWYAIAVALMTFVVGLIFVPNGTHKRDIFAADRLKQ